MYPSMVGATSAPGLMNSNVSSVGAPVESYHTGTMGASFWRELPLLLSASVVLVSVSVLVLVFVSVVVVFPSTAA
jgi:hypothetical protein